MSKLPDPKNLIPVTVMGTPSNKHKKSINHILATMLRNTTQLVVTETELANEVFPETPSDDTVHVLDGISDKHLVKIVELVFEFYQKLDDSFEKTVRDDSSTFNKYAGMIKSKPSSKKGLPKKRLTHKEKLLLEQEHIQQRQKEISNMDDDNIEKQCREALGL